MGFEMEGQQTDTDFTLVHTGYVTTTQQLLCKNTNTFDGVQ